MLKFSLLRSGSLELGHKLSNGSFDGDYFSFFPVVLYD